METSDGNERRRKKERKEKERKETKKVNSSLPDLLPLDGPSSNLAEQNTSLLSLEREREGGIASTQGEMNDFAPLMPPNG